MKAKKLEFINAETSSATVDRETFLSVLMRNLIEAKNKYPDVYLWPDTDVLSVFRELVDSLESDTYSRHCHAIQWTVKELKLKNDRKTINKIFKKG